MPRKFWAEIIQSISDIPLALQKTRNLKGIWMQLGIVNPEAAEKAKKAELAVVKDKCMKREYKHLIEGKKDTELEKIRAKKKSDMLKKSSKVEKISAPITVTDGNFSEIVHKYRLIVIDCWAAWCGPCRMVAPIIDELAKDYAGEIVFGKLNVDENPETATKYSIMGIPTLLIIKNGAEVDRMVGAAPKLLIQNKLKQHI